MGITFFLFIMNSFRYTAQNVMTGERCSKQELTDTGLRFEHQTFQI